MRGTEGTYSWGRTRGKNAEWPATVLEGGKGEGSKKKQRGTILWFLCGIKGVIWSVGVIT